MKKENTGCLMVVLPLALALLLSVFWLGYVFNNSTLYNFWYESADRVGISDYRTYGDEKPSLCVFPNCGAQAAKVVSTQHLYGTVDNSEKAIELILNLPNTANFQKCSDSFQYREKKEQAVYDEGYYLVPKSDGSIKVEKRVDKYIVHVDGAAKTISYTYLEGHYCEDHATPARSILRQELKEAFHTKNPGYYWCEYGLWILVAALALYFGILFGIPAFLAHKKGSANSYR